MPYLQLEGTQFPLLEGETRVGRGYSADMRLPSDTEVDVVDAVITIATDVSASIRRASSTSIITVNGVVLGSHPSPLFHGDHIAIDLVQLEYGDEAHAGMTMRLAAIGGDATRPPSERAGRRGRTGGRLVSLIDGREYTIRVDGLSIGREAGCDIVIASSEVSRRHARIELRPDGYLVIDSSTNGVLLNGTRVQRSHPLARGDTIKIGPEEFRFHADVAPAPETPHPPVILATPPAPARPLPPSATPPVTPVATATAPTLRSAPPPPAAATVRRPVLAKLEIINEGPTKGTSFPVDTQLAHVGRGAHNDIVIDDESVSDSHAKIQCREAGWFVVDMDSTNGTYVGGQRVKGEALLTSDIDVRFGGVKLIFAIIASSVEKGDGTRVIVGRRPRTPKMQDVIEPEESGEPPPLAPDDESGVPRLLLGGVLLLALVVVYLILQSL